MSLGPKCRLFSGYWNYNWAYFHVCATDFPPFSQTPWWFIAHIKPLRLSLLLLQSTGALILQYFITVINHWALKVQHRFLSDVQFQARFMKYEKIKGYLSCFFFVFVLRCVVLHVDSHVPRSHTDTEEDISDLMFLLLWSNLHLNNTVTVLIIFNCF